MILVTPSTQSSISVKPPTRSKQLCLVAALLFSAGLLVYARAIRFDFLNYDDLRYVAQNPRMSAGLSIANLAWSFKTFDCSNWHPLTWVTYLAVSQLFGVHPAPFHAANILIHATNGVLLFLLLNRMTTRMARSAIVAGLFLLHPLHVESVAWVSELKDVLCVMFMLLTMLAYLSYCKIPSTVSYLAVCAIFALSLMAKPMAVTLPLLLLLLDYWPLHRLIPLRRAVLEKLPLLALTLAASIVTTLAQRSAIERSGLLTFPVRLENAVCAYGRYLAKTFVPINLAVFYPHPAIVGAPQFPCFIGSLLVLLCTTALVVRRSRAQPHLIVGWLWFLGTLVPVIGLVQVGEQSMADRYTYFPLIGLFIALVWLVADTIPANLTTLRAVAGVGILLLCAICTEFQLGYWQNSSTLFSHALSVTQSNFIAMDHLAMESIERGRPAEAIPLAVESMRIDPASTYSYRALARAYDALGAPQKALAVYQQAITIDPTDAELHNNAANALAAMGRLPDAVAEYQQALAIDPRMVAANCNLAYLLAAEGQIDSAVAHWRTALTVDPENASAKKGLAMVHPNPAAPR